MKLLTPFAAIIAAAAAGQIYNTQPSEDYAHSAEVYQSALEYQQQGLYSDQSQAVTNDHAYAGHGGDQSQAYSGHARPAGEKTAKILSYDSERDGHGYHYSYETENGIKAQEAGQIIGHEKGTEAQGAYSYKGDDGHVYTVTYTADENGFHAQGAHLPTPPPIPEAIAKSLEQNAKDEAAGIYDDGKYTEHESHREQSIEHHEEVSSGHPAAQAFQYETAAYQQDFLPSHQLGHQAGNEHAYHQAAQSSHQGNQPAYHQAMQGHQSQLGFKLVAAHQAQQSGYQAAGHQFTGHQLTGHQLTGQGSYQGHQPSGFKPSYQTLNVPVEGYKKH